MIPKKIILHHSLTKDNDTVSWGVIRKYHINNCKWNDIGYHFGIENLRGQTEILMGRMLNKQGAHCKGYNSDSIGICFVGNYDVFYPLKESWNQGIKLVQSLMDIFNIDIKDVYGHREFNTYKSCPGRLFDLDKFRNDLKY